MKKKLDHAFNYFKSAFDITQLYFLCKVSFLVTHYTSDICSIQYLPHIHIHIVNNFIYFIRFLYGIA